MPAKIRVLLGEDHAIVREGTQRMLSEHPELEVVAAAGDGHDVLELLAELEPDVAILDLRMPGMSGIELTERARSLSPDTRILLLSAYDDDEFVLAAMEAGASGYLLKTVRASDLVDAVKAVRRGEIVLQPDISQKIARLWARKGPRPSRGPDDLLTPREIEVLRYVVRGVRNKDIANELAISVRTVEVHLSAILARLGVASRTEAAAYAAAQRWFPGPHDEDRES